MATSTTNYNFTLYEPDDVPTWLVGWNNTMTSIDSTIKSVDDKAIKSAADVGTLETQMQTATETLEQHGTDIEQAKTDIAGLKAQDTALGTRIDQQDIKIETLSGEVNASVDMVGKAFKGVLSRGETTLSIVVDKINEFTLVDVYISAAGVVPKSVEVRASSAPTQNIVVMAFDAQESDMTVAVVLRNPTYPS